MHGNEEIAAPAAQAETGKRRFAARSEAKPSGDRTVASMQREDGDRRAGRAAQNRGTQA
jgi:hypothetical protein